MLIRRVQDEGGFLDGLDVHLEPGLNVIIGARGSGKTSLIELVRYCLGSKHISEAAAKRAGWFPIAMLGDGRVTVTGDVAGELDQGSGRSSTTSRPREKPAPYALLTTGGPTSTHMEFLSTSTAIALAPPST